MWASALTLAGLMVVASAMSVVASDHKSGHGRGGAVSQQRVQDREERDQDKEERGKDREERENKRDDDKDEKHGKRSDADRGRSNRNAESKEAVVTSPTTVTPPGTVTPPAEPEDKDKDKDEDKKVEDRCVVGHVAGRSGKGQLRGGGVHLVIQADEDGALDRDLLVAAAGVLADRVCDDEDLTDAEFQAAVDAVDALAGLSVTHANAYQSDDEDDDHEDDDEEDEDEDDD
jgi:hypothetical protein